MKLFILLLESAWTIFLIVVFGGCLVISIIGDSKKLKHKK